MYGVFAPASIVGSNGYWYSPSQTKVEIAEGETSRASSWSSCDWMHASEAFIPQAAAQRSWVAGPVSFMHFAPQPAVQPGGQLTVFGLRLSKQVYMSDMPGAMLTHMPDG